MQHNRTSISWESTPCDNDSIFQFILVILLTIEFESPAESPNTYFPSHFLIVVHKLPWPSTYMDEIISDRRRNPAICPRRLASLDLVHTRAPRLSRFSRDAATSASSSVTGTVTVSGL